MPGLFSVLSLATVIRVVVVVALASAGCSAGADRFFADDTGEGKGGVAASSRVVRVVDGDTVELADGRTVRMLGIDTPERGECGYEAAAANLASLVEGRSVRLRANLRGPDSDRYGRLLRYLVDSGRDVGLQQILAGYANARYDSADGYASHPRQQAYRDADARTPHRCPALD